MRPAVVCLLLLVLVFSCTIIEASKFKELYGSGRDKTDRPVAKGQSKFKTLYGGEYSEYISSDIEVTTQHEQDGLHQQAHQFTLESVPLPSQTNYIDIVIVLLIGLFFVWLQLRSYSIKRGTQPRALHREERQVIEPESRSESEGEELVSDDGSNNSTQTEEIKEVKKEGLIKRRKQKIRIGEEIEEETKEEEKEEEKEEKERKDIKDEKEGKEEKEEKDQKEENKGKERQKEYIRRDETAKTEHSASGVNNIEEIESKNNCNNESSLIVTQPSITSVEQEEDEETQLQIRSNSDISQLTAMLEKMHLKLDPSMPTNEKIELVKIVQKQQEIEIQRAQHTSKVSIHQRTHRFRQDKEARRSKRDLERQNSLQDEIEQRRQERQLQEDEYHKMMILNLSAVIMLVIWLHVMNFSFFTHPFLKSSLPSSIQSTSFFSLPSSISSLFKLTSWLSVERVFYLVIIIVVMIVLFVLVPRLAPYVVLLCVFVHSWKSIFRAGAYSSFLWVFVSLSFIAFGKLLPRPKLVKLAILYTLNLLVAVLIGNLIARGDLLNPYRVDFAPDVFAYWLLSLLE